MNDSSQKFVSRAFSWRRVFELSFVVLAIGATSLLASSGTTPQPLGGGFQTPGYMQKLMGPDGQPKEMTAAGKKIAKKAAQEQLAVLNRNPHDANQALKEITELAVTQCELLPKYDSSITAADVKECKSFTATQLGSASKVDAATAKYTVDILRIGLLVQVGQKSEAEAQRDMARLFSQAGMGQ